MIRYFPKSTYPDPNYGDEGKKRSTKPNCNCPQCKTHYIAESLSPEPFPTNVSVRNNTQCELRTDGLYLYYLVRKLTLTTAFCA